MKKYVCIIRGCNFLMELEEVPEKVCFFTSRTVKANSVQEAEEQVIEQMRDEAALVERTLNEPEDTPMLYVEEMIERNRFARSHNGGLVFYYEDDEEGGAGALDLVQEAVGAKSAA